MAMGGKGSGMFDKVGKERLSALWPDWVSMMTPATLCAETPARVFKNAWSNNLAECPQLLISRLDGPLYFGSVEHVRRAFRRFETERQGQKHMIFIVKGVGAIDMLGADLLIEEATRRHKRGGSFHLQTKTPRTISKLARFKVMKALTKQQIHLSKRDTIADVFPLLGPNVCATCKARIFSECPRAPAVAGHE